MALERAPSRHHPRRLAPLAALLALLGGCFPVAWVTPPAQLELGAGAQLRSDRSEVAPVLPTRVGFFPLQAFPSRLDRRGDFGLGYQLIPTTARPMHHGPYLDAAYMTTTAQLPTRGMIAGEASATRFGVRTKGHLLFAATPTAQPGWGSTVQLTVDWFEFSRFEFEGCDVGSDTGVCAVGWAYGETSRGIFVEAGYAEVGGLEMWTVAAGLVVRVPATVGAGFVFGDAIE